MPKKQGEHRKPGEYLARRQQQIMDIIYRRGQADVAAVLEDLPDPLSNPCRACSSAYSGRTWTPQAR